MSASEVLSAIAPQFDTAGNRAALLAQAEGATSSTHFGSQRERAVALRAAHFLSLYNSSARLDGSSGPITSKSEGSLSIGFGGNGSRSASSLSQTSYGQELLALINSYPVAGITGLPFIVGSSPWQ